ncbi:hypothetical protein Tco_1192897 [Tanacetum coccineum]
MSTLKFAETYNLVAFLEKSEQSNGFVEIIDFLNAISVQYALTFKEESQAVGKEKEVKTFRAKKVKKDLNADAKVTLVNETEKMNDVNLIIFNTVSVATTAKSIPVSNVEVVTTASASVVIPDELTLAQTLIDIKNCSKTKHVTTADTQKNKSHSSTKHFSSSRSTTCTSKDKGKGTYGGALKYFEEESSSEGKEEANIALIQKDRYEHVEAEKSMIQNEEELKKHMEIVQHEKEMQFVTTGQNDYAVRNEIKDQYQRRDKEHWSSTYPNPTFCPFEELLNDIMNPPDELVMDDSESDIESYETPLVSPFLNSDDESDNGEVINELNEYGNA